MTKSRDPARPRRSKELKEKAGQSRRARFLFRHGQKIKLDAKALRRFSKAVGLDISDLERLSVDGERSRKNEPIYRELDALLLPAVELYVFFENFSVPGRIFTRPQGFQVDMKVGDGRIEKCRVTRFTLVLQGGSRVARTLDVAIEAVVLLDVCNGVEFGGKDSEHEGAVARELRECRNMFNFAFKEFEYDDDEPFEHEWSARFVKE